MIDCHKLKPCRIDFLKKKNVIKIENCTRKIYIGATRNVGDRYKKVEGKVGRHL